MDTSAVVAVVKDLVVVVLVDLVVEVLDGLQDQIQLDQLMEHQEEELMVLLLSLINI